jgi:hypothetical protein
MEINVGDYFLTHDYELFQIINQDTTLSGSTSYDLRATRPRLVGIPDYANCFYEYPTLKAVGRHTLRHMGVIIPINKITPAMKLLYME